HNRRCANLVNDYLVKRFSVQRVLDGGGYAAFGVRAGKRPAAAAQLFGCIPHDKRVAGKGKHFNVVIVITNGHDLFAGNAPVVGPALQRVSLGTAGVEHIHNRKVTAGVLGAQNIACTGSQVSASSIGTTNLMYCMFFSSQRWMLPSSWSSRSSTMVPEASPRLSPWRSLLSKVRTV